MGIPEKKKHTDNDREAFIERLLTVLNFRISPLLNWKGSRRAKYN